MKLPEAQVKILVQKINSLWKGTKICPICEEEKWNISDMLYEIRQFGAGNEKKGKVIPAIVVTCKKCGNMTFLNAINLGFSFKNDGDKN